MSQESHELSGQQIGQYTVGEIIGRGGMATVYKAQQTSIGRTVAIKVMPTQFLSDPNFLGRFKREVEVIAQLQHPRILPVYDYGDYHGRPYIVMAYLDGGTLTERIKQGPMPLEEVTRIVGQIADALDFAHGEEIIHRDFKPSNVLLDRRGNAYLADFGIAKVSEATVQLTGSGIIGTPAYMAPEMADSGEVSPAIDIYALGVTIYEMLTGKYPFEAETPLRVMMAHATSPIPDVREARPDLPVGVTAVVQRAMAKDPMDRYQSASDLAKALEAAASSDKVGDTMQEERLSATALDAAPAPVPPHAPTADGLWKEPALPTDAQPQRTGALAPPPPIEERAGPRWGLIIGIAAVVLLLCCGSGALFAFGSGMFSSDEPTQAAAATPVPSTNVPEPTPIPPTEASQFTPPPPPTEGLDLPGVIVENQSGGPICEVYIAPHEDPEWGQNRLDISRLKPGDNFRVPNVPPGQYDFMAMDCQDNVYDQHYKLPLDGQGDYMWVLAPADAEVIIINGSSVDICNVNISHSEDDHWGINYLDENEVITPGDSFSVPKLPTGVYDLRAVDCNDTEYKQLDINLFGAYSWTVQY
jgi:tRNA A-37 threonylcarbamoyl transferase component Bud32